MENKNTTRSGGVDFIELLTIVFITLKLCGVISWSWIWVLSPLWIPYSILFLVMLLIIFTLGSMCNRIINKKIILHI